MTQTPIPTPPPRESGYMVVCDGCLTAIKVHDIDELPVGWTRVYIRGWVGSFHACSGRCEEKIIKDRETKAVPRYPILIIS